MASLLTEPTGGWEGDRFRASRTSAHDVRMRPFLAAGPNFVLRPFRYISEPAGKWVGARYLAESNDNAAPSGPRQLGFDRLPQLRKRSGQWNAFHRLRNARAHLPPVEEPPPHNEPPEREPPDNEPPNPPVEEPPVATRLNAYSRSNFLRRNVRSVGASCWTIYVKSLVAVG